MAQPLIHHRTRTFRLMFGRLLERLGEVHRTSGDVLLSTASGTGAMEGAVANLCSPGDRVLVASAGNFGERWATLAEAYGCDVVHMRYEWGETPNAGRDRGAARRGGRRAGRLLHAQRDLHRRRRATSRRSRRRAPRPARSPSWTPSRASRAVPLDTEAWGIDVVVARLPEGAHDAARPGDDGRLATRALAAAERSTSPRFYFDWARAVKSQSEDPPVTPFTPAISLVYGLDAALGLILEEGLDAVFDRHVRLGRACRAGVKAMGLELFSPDEDRSAVVTAIRMPEGVDGADVIRTVAEHRAITIEGGRGPLAGKIVRIGHIGYIDVEDVVAGLTRGRGGARRPRDAGRRGRRGARGLRMSDRPRVLVRESIAEARDRAAARALRRGRRLATATSPSGSATTTR